MMADMIKLSAAAPRSVPAINKYILPAGTSIGNVQYSNFGTAVTAMADELSGALGFGSATDMSREMGFNLTDPNLSPAQFEAGMQTVVKPFIEQKLKTLQGRWASMQKPLQARRRAPALDREHLLQPARRQIHLVSDSNGSCSTTSTNINDEPLARAAWADG